MRDSDSDPTASFVEVCRQIRDAGGFTVPTDPNVRTASVPTISVTLIPDSAVPGNLETLLLRAVTNHQHLTPCLETFFNCCAFDAEPISIASKKKLTIIIAARNANNPSCTLTNIWSGEQNRWNPIDGLHPAFQPIVDFLRQYKT